MAEEYPDSDSDHGDLRDMCSSTYHHIHLPKAKGPVVLFVRLTSGRCVSVLVSPYLIDIDAEFQVGATGWFRAGAPDEKIASWVDTKPDDLDDLFVKDLLENIADQAMLVPQVARAIRHNQLLDALNEWLSQDS